MIDKQIIFEIHRLRDARLSLRKIARKLCISRKAVKRHLDSPGVKKKTRQRTSKLDIHKQAIDDFLKLDPEVSAVVIKQNLEKIGYQGGITILRDYLRKLRRRKLRAYIRFETAPGKQCQMDWGYFGYLTYGKTQRRLYCFAMIECHSRLLYLEFTHSMAMDSFLRCIWHAFLFMGGTPEELVHDNLKTAVTERVGSVIRFNDRYLDFLRQLHVVPIACNQYAAWEKGKIEKGGIHYIRNNFWPCRKFTDINDVNRQAWEWRDQIANVRIHSTTREKPSVRFKRDKMRPLPEGLEFDLRDAESPKVHLDTRAKFDVNYYSTPPWAVGKTVNIKADNQQVSIYYKDRLIAVHPRSWEKNIIIENPKHIDSILKNKKKAFRTRQEKIFLSLGEPAEIFLEGLANAGKPLEKSINQLLVFKDVYGKQMLLKAIKLASRYGAYGMDYIKNIIYQQANPALPCGRVVLNKKELDDLRLHEVDLKEYDSYILERRPSHE